MTDMPRMTVSKPPAAASAGGTQSIRRTIGLLRALVAAQRRGATSAELAARTGLDRSTARRMLQCLAEEDVLAFDSATRRYHFGHLAYDMGLAASERLDLPQLCKPALARIADDTGDTVFLMMRSGDDAICADRAVGSYPIKTFIVDVGTRRPLGIGAGSLAMLSALPEDVAELVLANNVPRLGAYAGMNEERLRAMLREARGQGHVAMDVVDVPGARTVAVPILTGAGRPVAALSVAAIAMRMTPEREAMVLAVLRREAEGVGRLLTARSDQEGRDA
ncbi:IclR family transcriptional regulator [Achromobacter aloeverae]|uniref:IclR family transcriptional regulator n=1 Tax=Achromobacter aloeverae TaxID=1750518 RepID=A0A4Q1HMV1_9BURK|nr:IclR family transcriptional regulator [Achromobacter aloeverae]RXN92312.1 IclR family transcriptional regulator [Achromobacter aloeverae]